MVNRAKSLIDVWRFAGRLRWARVVGEGAVIVVGILLAFAIDAWWAERAERRSEAYYLAALERELLTTRERVEHNIRFHEAVSTNIHQLLDAVGRGGPLPQDSVRTWLRGVVVSNSFVPITAAYDDMTATDGLRLLRSDRLRIEIALYRGILSEYAQIEQAAEVHWRSALIPLLNRDIALLDLFDNNAASRQRLGPGLSRIVADPRFRNELALRYILVGDVVGSSDQVRGQIDDVLLLLNGTERATGGP